MDKFQIVAKLGEGCFGTVYRAVNTETAAPVALKVVPLQRLQDGLPDAPVRELLSLQHLADSPRVVRLHEAFPCGGALVFVLELCRGDYAGILRRQPGWCGLPLAVAKCLADQLLEALDDIHSRGVVHRDVKPGNVLLDARGTAKLGDFGLARLAEPRGDWTHEVATRWYRAPELLFGARDYGPGVDMWGAGCVVAELIAGGGSGVLFPGTGDIDQIAKIFRVLGTPSPETHPTLTALPDWGKVEFAAQPGTGLGAVLPRACPLALDLLGRLLSLEPQRRISAANARRHPFFFTAPLPAVAAEVVLPPPLPRAPSVAAIIDGATRRGRPAAVTTGPLHLWTHTALPFEQAPV